MSVLAKNKTERLEWMKDHLAQSTAAIPEYKELFGLGTSTFWQDRKEVLKGMQDALDDDLEAWARDLLQRYELIYERAINTRNLKVATKVLEDIQQLKGLNTSKVEVKTDNTVELNWGLDE